MAPIALLPLRRKACWGFFRPQKSWRLRPGLNPRTWVLKGSTLPLDHWSRFCQRFTLETFAWHCNMLTLAAVKFYCSSMTLITYFRKGGDSVVIESDTNSHEKCAHPLHQLFVVIVLIWASLWNTPQSLANKICTEKFTLEQATKAQRGNRGIDVLFL
jgi:hypothetical protein